MKEETAAEVVRIFMFYNNKKAFYIFLKGRIGWG